MAPREQPPAPSEFDAGQIFFVAGPSGSDFPLIAAKRRPLVGWNEQCPNPIKTVRGDEPKANQLDQALLDLGREQLRFADQIGEEECAAALEQVQDFLAFATQLQQQSRGGELEPISEVIAVEEVADYDLRQPQEHDRRGEPGPGRLAEAERAELVL